MTILWQLIVGGLGNGPSTSHVRVSPAPGPREAAPLSLPRVRPGGPGEDTAAGPYGPPVWRDGAGVQTCRTVASSTPGRRRPSRGFIGLLEQLGLVIRRG